MIFVRFWDHFLIISGSIWELLRAFWDQFGPKWWPWYTYFPPWCPLLPQMTGQGSPRYSFGPYLATSGQFCTIFRYFWSILVHFFVVLATCRRIWNLLGAVFVHCFRTIVRHPLPRRSDPWSVNPPRESDPKSDPARRVRSSVSSLFSFRFHCSLCALSFVLYIWVVLPPFSLRWSFHKAFSPSS